MTKERSFLNATEFSQETGIPSSTVTKLLRAGKIKGQKKSGKWVIPKSELQSPAVTGSSGSESAESNPVEKKTVTGKTYSVSEFAHMTYLTEKGVADWLNKGLLTGKKTSPEDWQVDAANLELPDVKRLLR